jgi:hypothetical protein
MKSFIFLISVAPCLLFNKILGQDVQKNVPSTKYNVHREYDKDGNLIHYDSTSVSTWNYGGNPVQDSLVQNRDNDMENPLVLNDSIYSNDSSYLGFDYPDQEFNFNGIPDINDFFNNKSFNNKDIARQMQEMEKRMNEMMRRNMEFFKQFNDQHFYFEVPGQEPTDSIIKPEKPKKMKNSIDNNIINI